MSIPPAASKVVIHVAAGIVNDTKGRVLIAKRPEAAHQGGLWEFPGGKLESGESVEQGLRRELAEELGIQVFASRPLIRLSHDYRDRRVLLDIHQVLDYQGTPQGREGQPLDWLAPEAMDADRFPAADRPVISALRLPSRYLITGAGPAAPDAFLMHLEQRLARTGVPIVQLRAPWLDTDRYADLARRCAALCRRMGALLLVNCEVELATRLPVDGLHLNEQRLLALDERPDLGRCLIGASCHDADALARAATLGLDYALLSPVCPTRSHPEAEPLGWKRFAALVEPAPLPVYALGGVGDPDLQTAWRHGAQGVAGISGFWSRSTSKRQVERPLAP
ncbi:MAG: Nudix family hydrolase [Gammaproteobacteria bacterium]|jgi:8-oxo-dGTP diphosphatase|nr:Nudix family hydrolase [Gammaproteobacteria bacterium]